MKHSLLRRSVAEFVGTLFLLATVVGSGIMGENLAGGNIAIAHASFPETSCKTLIRMFGSQINLTDCQLIHIAASFG